MFQELMYSSQTGVVYVCSYCQAPTPQPFGRIVDKETTGGNLKRLYRTAQGPPAGGSGCEHCGGTQHVSLQVLADARYRYRFELTILISLVDLCGLDLSRIKNLLRGF